MVNFGPLTTKFICLILRHLKSTFSEDHISAPSGCCPFKFLPVLENDQSLPPHTQPLTWYLPIAVYSLPEDFIPKKLWK